MVMAVPTATGPTPPGELKYAPLVNAGKIYVAHVITSAGSSAKGVIVPTISDKELL